MVSIIEYIINVILGNEILIKAIIIIIGYISVAIIGDAINKKILDQYNPFLKKSGIEGAGKIIGIFERILILTFVLADQYTAITIIFTAKSIARFNELKKRKMAEYYLIGTFTSITIAVIGGVILKLVLGNFKI